MDLRLPPGLFKGPRTSAGGGERFALRTLQAALGQPGFALAAATVASEMAREWVCSRVFVGLVDRRFAKVVALSNSGPLSGKAAAMPLLVDVARAMDEALDQGAHVASPQHPDERHPRVTRAHEQLAHRHGTGALLTVPLFVDAQAVGALTFERTAGQFFDDAWAQQVHELATTLAPLMQLQVRAEQGVLARWRADLSRHWQGLSTRSRQTWLVVVPALVLLGVGLLWVPLQHQVSATSTLQGRVQRAVVSPLDGYLKAVHVRPGDEVKAGDLLAELVDDDLRLEQRRRQTEVSQHESAYGDAMARRDRSALVLAEARAAESRAQLGLVESQLSRTRLVAPFDGLVIAGDLREQLAAPLRRGELLFTLTPSREMRLMLQVDERDSAHVRAGQSGAVTFSALPSQRFEVVIERVSPVAQVVEGRNVFEAEARLLTVPAAQAQTPSPLRPGMQGLTQVQAGREPIGWLMGHRVLDWLRLQWWRWVG